MFINNLKFGLGLGFFKETQIYLFPANYVLSCFKLGIDNFESEIFKKKIKQISFDDCYILFQKFKYLKQFQSITYFLDYIKFFGFGELKLVVNSSGKLTFLLINSSYSSYFEKVYDVFPVVQFEEILAGFLENYLSLIYGKKVICNIRKSKISYYFDLEITNEIFSLVSDKFYPNFRSGNISLALKKIILNKVLTFEKGLFLFSGVKAFNLPYYFILNFIELLDINNLGNYFNSLGIAQGRAIYGLHKFLGSDDGDDVFFSFLDLSELSCTGFYEIINLNKRDVRLINNLDFYLNFYENSVIELFFSHMANIYKSVYEFSFNQKCNLKFSFLREINLTEIQGDVHLTELEEIYFKSLTIKILYTDKK